MNTPSIKTITKPTLNLSVALGALTPLFLLLAGQAHAAPQPLKIRHDISLDSYTGQTFLETMLGKDFGIKAHFDADYEENYRFANWPSTQRALRNSGAL